VPGGANDDLRTLRPVAVAGSRQRLAVG
jgi:hypothetical protein